MLISSLNAAVFPKKAWEKLLLSWGAQRSWPAGSAEARASYACCCPSPQEKISSLRGVFSDGKRDGRKAEVSLMSCSRLMAKSFPCSGVPTIRLLYLRTANRLVFSVMVNLIGNKSTSKFIGSSQGLVSRVIKQLIISGNVNCIFNFICILTFALAKNSLYKWDWKGKLETDMYELVSYRSGKSVNIIHLRHGAPCGDWPIVAGLSVRFKVLVV